MSKKSSDKHSNGVWKLYKVEEGKITFRRTDCPKCGHGVFLAEHNDRFTCGRCGYTKFKA